MKRIVQLVLKSLFVRGRVRVGKGFHIGPGTRVWSARGLSLGRRVYIGKWCTIEVDGSIGDNVLIANNVGIVGRYDHAFRTVGVPVRDAPWVGDDNYMFWDQQGEVNIEADVWIGFGAIVLSGVRVGRGSIVAAGALVKSDVEPYSIVAGVPARKVGKRFSESEIVAHELAIYHGAEGAG